VLKKTILTLLIVAVVGFLLIQLIPYGRDHTNPPVVQEPAWDSPATRELAQRACFDCHSNQVVWPWYSHIAPASWLVAHDVQEARGYLNFSPPQYKLMHKASRLTAAERQQLLDGLLKTLQ
jgi:hypothetical protein